MIRKISLIYIIITIGLISVNCNVYKYYCFETYNKPFRYQGWNFEIRRFDATNYKNDPKSTNDTFQLAVFLSYPLDKYYKTKVPLNYIIDFNDLSYTLNEIDVIVDTIKIFTNKDSLINFIVLPDSGWSISKYGYDDISKSWSWNNSPVVSIPKSIDIIYITTKIMWFNLPQRILIDEKDIKFKYLKVKEKCLFYNIDD